MLTEREGFLNLSLEYQEGRRNKILTPELVKKYWQGTYNIWGGVAGLHIIVPDFPGTQEDLDKHQLAGDKIIYVHKWISTQAKRHRILAVKWPELAEYMVRNMTSFGQDLFDRSEADNFGYRYAEASLTLPLQRQADELSNPRVGIKDMMSPTEYIIASLDAKAVEGHYFDEDTLDNEFITGQHFDENALFLLLRSWLGGKADASGDFFFGGGGFVYIDFFFYPNRAPDVKKNPIAHVLGARHKGKGMYGKFFGRKPGDLFGPETDWEDHEYLYPRSHRAPGRVNRSSEKVGI